MGIDPRIREMGELSATFLFDVVADLKPTVEIGEGPFGFRRYLGATGGSFEGPRLRGEVLPGGGDWALERPDSGTLDARSILRTYDGALIYMTYSGRIARAAGAQGPLLESIGYYRTNPLFETGSKKYAWLNDVVGIGVGYLVEGGVGYRIFQIN